MTAPAPPPIDAVSAAITIASAFVGPALAEVLGTYAVIVAAGLCGALLSLRRREAGTRLQGLAHLVVWTSIATLVAVPLAQLASPHVAVPPLWLIAPVAVLLAGVGDDWPAVATWAWDAVGRWRRGSGNGGAP